MVPAYMLAPAGCVSRNLRPTQKDTWLKIGPGFYPRPVGVSVRNGGSHAGFAGQRVGS